MHTPPETIGTPFARTSNCANVGDPQLKWRKIPTTCRSYGKAITSLRHDLFGNI